MNIDEIYIPLLRKWEADAFADGFKPHLAGICADVRRLRKRHGELPAVHLSKMPDGIDYWTPEMNKTQGGIMARAMAYRLLVGNGLTETLQIGEAVVRDSQEEVLWVHWLTRQDQLCFVAEITGGYVGAFRAVEGGDFEIKNPALWPWNTNEEIADYLDVTQADRPRMIADLEEMQTVLEMSYSKSGTVWPNKPR